MCYCIKCFAEVKHNKIHLQVDLVMLDFSKAFDGGAY